MQFGITIFTTDRTATPACAARAAEEAGFDLLLFPDHTHVPVHGSSRFPGGGPIPDHYARNHDAVVAATAALTVTSRLAVAIGVCLVPARDPIILAKQAACLDQLSAGRFALGVGVGWNAQEIRNHGIEPAQRWDVMAERVEAMQTIWREDEAEYHGRHVDFGPIRSWPKPAGEHRPRILVGGHGDGVLQRVVAYGDEWIAMPAPGRPPFAERVGELERLAEQAGRERPTVAVQLYGAPDASFVEKYAAAGAQRIDLTVPPAPATEMIDAIVLLGCTIADLRGGGR